MDARELPKLILAVRPHSLLCCGSMDGPGRRPAATVGHDPPQRLMIFRFAPNRCLDAEEIVFEAVLDERTAVVLPVPFIDAEPLFERIG